MTSNTVELSIIARMVSEADRSSSIIVQAGAIDAVIIMLREWADQARLRMQGFPRGAEFVASAEDLAVARARIALARSGAVR
jgi:hypothetical protein